MEQQQIPTSSEYPPQHHNDPRYQQQQQQHFQRVEGSASAQSQRRFTAPQNSISELPSSTEKLYANCLQKDGGNQFEQTNRVGGYETRHPLPRAIPGASSNQFENRSQYRAQGGQNMDPGGMGQVVPNQGYPQPYEDPGANQRGFEYKTRRGSQGAADRGAYGGQLPQDQYGGGEVGVARIDPPPPAAQPRPIPMPRANVPHIQPPEVGGEPEQLPIPTTNPHPQTPRPQLYPGEDIAQVAKDWNLRIKDTLGPI